MAMISISKLSPADVEGVFRVSQQSFAAPWSLEAIEAEIHNPLAWYLVARAEAAVIGFLGAWLVMDEVQITNIAVAPDWRGQGVASKLLADLIDTMMTRAMTTMILEVRNSNLPARHLYESAGFQYAGYRRNFYPDGEDAHVMTLDLTQKKPIQR